MKKRCAIKIVAFVMIFAIIFGTVAKVVTVPQDYRNYQWVAGFYEEEKNSLDAVYIGSSNCYSFWNSMTAWNEYGINVWPYATNGMMFEATEYIMKEARKTQPDAMYIVNINAICDPDKNGNRIHWNVDYMPFSLNKLALTHRLVEACDFSLAESMEFYIPMIRYHGRWSELQEEDFTYEVDGVKGASYYNPYLKKSEDVTEYYETSNESATLEPDMVETLNRLLDYCEKEEVKVLFVTVPRAEKDDVEINAVSVFQAANELIESRGFPTLYLTESMDEIHLDMTTDYYNYRHTNIHGSIKYTRYLSEYLIEHYGFEDKRGEKAYSDWNKGWKKYEKMIAPWILDFELDGTHRDYSLLKPENLRVLESNKGVILNWTASEGASGYAIYKKVGSSGTWELLDETFASGYEYEDEDVAKGKRVTYRVVPICEKEGETYYGSFDYNGVSIQVD